MTISAPMTITWREGRSSPAGDCPPCVVNFCFSALQTLDIAAARPLVRKVTPRVVNISVLNRLQQFCSISATRSLVG